MPLHDFKCDHCSIVFEELLSVSQILPDTVPTSPCPTCGDSAPRIYSTPPALRGVENSTSAVVWYEHPDGRVGTPLYDPFEKKGVKKLHDWYASNGFNRKVAVREKDIHKAEERLSESNKSPMHFTGKD